MSTTAGETSATSNCQVRDGESHGEKNPTCLDDSKISRVHEISWHHRRLTPFSKVKAQMDVAFRKSTALGHAFTVLQNCCKACSAD